MGKIRLAIVDDHEVVRQGLRGFLELLDDIEIVGEGRTGKEAVELARSIEPDIILMDVLMPEMSGVDATIAILAENPNIRILILSSFSDEETIFPALEAGAVGYVLKDISPDELADVLRDTHQGKTRLHPDIATKLIERMKRPANSEPTVSPKLESLTEREREVLQAIGRGMSNKEIAGELFISPMTVKTHVSNLLGKLDLFDRTQAAIFAIRQGLVGEE